MVEIKVKRKNGLKDVSGSHFATNPVIERVSQNALEYRCDLYCKLTPASISSNAHTLLRVFIQASIGYFLGRFEI
jgi:hypothetical protein